MLVYDKTGQDIIGPLLSLKELRELGVTLHLLLHSTRFDIFVFFKSVESPVINESLLRDSIPDAPCVYFCLPTDDNVQRICQVLVSKSKREKQICFLDQDLGNNLYGGYHYNFISPVSRPQLEDIATAALQAGCEQNVQRLFDQYTNFICLEEDMFCLKHQNSPEPSVSYYSLNRGSVTDSEMDSMMSTITDCLFALFVTLGTVPIIRCPAGNAAEYVATKLDKKLRENLRDARNSLFSDGTATGRYSFHRPVLVLVDRAMDMATPLHHTWTYQALAHDVLPYHQNRVTLDKNKTYELDHKDEFWVQHRGSPFPQVAEAIQEELEEIKGKEEEIKRMKSDLGMAGSDMDDALSNLNLNDNTAKLTSAVSSLPQLLEKKRLIDMHCSLATSVLDSIKQRRLDVFFELEEKLMSATPLDRSLMEVLTDPENISPEDKLRLFLIFYISTPEVSEKEFKEYSDALREAGCDLSTLAYLKVRLLSESSPRKIPPCSDGKAWQLRAVRWWRLQEAAREPLRPSPCSAASSARAATLSWPM